MDTANGWMDIGTTNLPWAVETPLNPWNDKKPEMPLFKVTCDKADAPHPFLGRVNYTQDPGRALITGRCNDVGTIVLQQFRGLAVTPRKVLGPVAAGTSGTNQQALLRGPTVDAVCDALARPAVDAARGSGRLVPRRWSRARPSSCSR